MIETSEEEEGRDTHTNEEREREKEKGILKFVALDRDKQKQINKQREIINTEKWSAEVKMKTDRQRKIHKDKNRQKKMEME